MNLIALAGLPEGLSYLVVGLLVAALVVGILYVRGKRRQARRRHLRGQPFPPEWEQILQQNVPLYRRLPEELCEELHAHMLVFIAEKRFEGCGGLEITDEIRVTIAAQACLLLLQRETKYYPTLSSILVYPRAYVAPSRVSIGGGVVSGAQARAGESWRRGEVVIAWDQALRGAANVHDGHDVVLHEFAHQLDQEDGVADGAPILEHRSSYVTWARVLGKEYEKLQQRTKRRRKSFLNKYGATHPAEFFAVATETFFEKPKYLKRKKPDLYEELKSYYRLDPVTWRKPDDAPG